MGRSPCCDKTNVKKGPWSPEEDATLKEHILKFGIGGNWITLPQKAGLKRCGKSCRLRWLNYLRPNIRHGNFTEEEDSIICNLFAKIGSRWSIMAAQLPGRTDNDIKNYWNTKLKKKIMGTSSRKTKPVTSFFDPIAFLSQNTDSSIARNALLSSISSLTNLGGDHGSSSSGWNYMKDQQKLFCYGGSLKRESDICGEAQLDNTLEKIRQLLSADQICVHSA